MRNAAGKILGLFSNERFVFCVALIIHISIVFALGHYRSPSLWENGVIARGLFAGNGFAMPLYQPPTRNEDGMIENMGNSKGSLPPLMKPQPTSNQAPGYPFLLFITWKLLGMNTAAYLTLSLIQAILVSSIVFPIRWLTKRWFGENAGIVACWIVCLMPAYAWFATRIHQAPIVITFHPWLLAGWLRLTEENSLRRTAGVGLGTGIAGLFQPILLGVYGVIGLILMLKSWTRRNTRSVMMLVLAALLVILVLVPWSIRNYRVHGELVLIKNCFSKEVWIGNNPQATGTSVLRGGTRSVVEALPPECFGLTTEMEYMNALQRDAINYVQRKPMAFVLRTLKKIVWFWTTVPRVYLTSVGEAPRLRFYWLNNSYWFSFLLLAVFARIGCGRFPGEYSMALIVYFVFYSIIYGLTHVGHARFRGEIEYIVIPAVAQGIILVWNIRNYFLQGR